MEKNIKLTNFFFMSLHNFRSSYKKFCRAKKTNSFVVSAYRIVEKTRNLLGPQTNFFSSISTIRSANTKISFLCEIRFEADSQCF